MEVGPNGKSKVDNKVESSKREWGSGTNQSNNKEFEKKKNEVPQLWNGWRFAYEYWHKK